MAPLSPERSRNRKVRAWQWLFRKAERRELVGLSVGVLWPPAEDASVVWLKVEQALTILAQNDRRRFDRLRSDADGILVFGTVGALAYWVQGARLIVIQWTYAAAADTSPAALASILVHEGAHAWLDRLGFGWQEDRRKRIEAICSRSQIAFARRLPDPGDLIEHAERQLALESSHFTDDAFRKQDLSELRELGVPGWLVRFLRLVSRAPAA